MTESNRRSPVADAHVGRFQRSIMPSRAMVVCRCSGAAGHQAAGHQVFRKASGVMPMTRLKNLRKLMGSEKPIASPMVVVDAA
ncbi:MAG: hypothetical protein ABIF28_17495 [Pseudomonadota bacterium]